MTTRTVHVITTGGTIEKAYSERDGSVANLDNKIDRYLSLLRLPEWDVNVVPLMNIDSLEMSDKDRTLVLGMVRAILTENAPILVTHGTDTLVQTGLFIQRALPSLSVPIVLTGAMTPLGFEGSDGLQNLTESLMALQFAKPGVYVVTHGTCFPVEQSPQETGHKRRSEMHNTIQIIGNLGRDPEQREARANGAPFTVLSVATRRAWKNAEGNWESRTDWHRVVCFQRIGESALALHKGDQVFIAGSLVSSKYDRTVGNGKKPATLKLTSWQIRANILRKLNRAAKEPEATASGSHDGSDSAPF